MSQNKVSKIFVFWSLSAVPYGTITAYSGSISSLDNPVPAIFTAIALTLVLSLWLAYFQEKNIKQNFGDNRLV